jgi:hypothetical protein
LFAIKEAVTSIRNLAMKKPNMPFLTCIFANKLILFFLQFSNKEKKSFQYISILLILINFLHSCKPHTDCYGLGLVPISPYSNPVWYPDGSMLGFNHQPLKSVAVINPCHPYYLCDYYSDSIGFWLINKDGSNMRRATFFQLETPAWSPDGKWIAFSNGGQIYKMPFDGNNFDTANVFRLTSDSYNHFFPSWSPEADTIYYDSDKANTSSPYQVYKMAADGSGQTIIGNKGIDSIYSRDPYCTPDKQILHVRGDSTSTHVFSMDTNGDNVKQVTKNISSRIYIGNPEYFNNKIFYQDNGVWSANTDGSALIQLCFNSTQRFSISKEGIIAYVNFSNTDTAKIDKTHGTIWIMNADGSNQRSFTFNNY